MTRALLPAVLIASAISVSAAFAEVTPRPGPHDNRVRIATWTEGQVYRVVTSCGFQKYRTGISLNPGQPFQ